MNLGAMAVTVAAPPVARRVAMGVGLLLCVWPAAALTNDAAPEPAARVQAAFLRNFARYVAWPARAFAGERSPWTVCVLGSDPFGAALEGTFDGRTEQGRSFEVVRANEPEQLPACHIVFLGDASATKRRAVLAQLKGRPVLTVANAPDFLNEGGVIRLTVSERVEMGINLDQARAASLTIPAKMLEVARDVVDNGALRRLR
ncbi:YfiR family protein [Ideonella sp.]|uniref:YfiR family protein n=1 Tax=Ideonella sp. TaxID=1929293 RepID=UPI002B4AA8A4|nr:YfiR family protein [Ideonella sp.]HJV71651.1 YfiR family protein [Ideonella sp.]